MLLTSAWRSVGASAAAAPGLIVEPVRLGTAADAWATEPAPATPSLVDTAMASVQSAAQSLVGNAAGSLPSRPLLPEAFQQLAPQLGQAEARLIEIYQLIAQGAHRPALAQAESLVRDHPNFQLAQLVLGDLLSLQTRAVRQLGDVADHQAAGAAEQLAALRDESRRRMRALTERPPEGHVPTQFLTLSSQSRHAIAVDASRSRLYLFENTTASQPDGNGAPRLRLLGDYYISVGLSGIDKSVEGDKRTPLGVYYITSNLKPDNLPDLYGVGALPINYPNPLDLQRGKTGSGIWLHGTPREQFVRAPQASDGCVVLSNPDLQRLLSTVQIRTTPVVIAPELQWVEPTALDGERRAFEDALDAWRMVKGRGDLDRLKGFYSSRFANQGRDLAQWWPRVENETQTLGARELQLKDVSILRWRDRDDTMVVTFGEVALGQTRGVTKRQYWMRERDQWKIFFEGTL
ncbi:MAG: L,D-transpeptidase family protein [Hydrogenophaga sp.]|nr:L,D-transpeptidase family protein [Hydrogenophaga sp.]